MRMIRVSTLVSVACIAATVSNVAGAAPIRNTQEVAPAKRALPSASKTSRPYFAIEVFPAIRPEELQRYLALLNLDESQRSIVRVLYIDYHALDGEHRSAAFPALIERSADIRAMGTTVEPAVAEAHVEFITTEVAKLWRELETIESEFLGDIETLLAEDQLESFSRVRDQRTRMRASVVRVLYPWGRLDLADLIWPIMRDGDLDAQQQASIDEILLEYDHTMTPLAVERLKSVRKLKVEMVPLRASVTITPEVMADERLRGPAIERYHIVHAELRRMNRAYVRIAERAHETTRDFLERCRSILPPEDGDDLLRRFREASYRWVYPNPFDVSDVLDEAAAIEGIDADRRAAIIAVAASNHGRQEEVNEQMVQTVIERKKDLAITLANPREVREAFEARMFELDRQRAELGRDALRFVKDTLTPEELSEIADAIARREEQMLEASDWRRSRLR